VAFGEIVWGGGLGGPGGSCTGGGEKKTLSSSKGCEHLVVNINLKQLSFKILINQSVI